MDDFKGKTAVVTGAASGIGRALARHAGSLGMQVAMADINEGALQRLQSQFEARDIPCLTAALDVSNPDQMQDFAKKVSDKFGAADLLFNNAGILRTGNSWEHSHAQWQQMLDVNVMGVVNGINAFLPGMLERKTHAHIVNTGSVGSLVASPGMGQYTACKMAVRGITESLHYEMQVLGGDIGVSLLCPGPIMTQIADGMMGVETGAEVVESDEHPLVGAEEFMRPERVAEIVYSAIAESRYWIFTHPLTKHLHREFEGVLAGRNPVFENVRFDD